MSRSYDSIKSRAEFRRLAADGRKAPCRTIVLQHIAAETGVAVGFTVSRQVGNAVVRNRVKRKLRAITAELAAAGEIPAGMMAVIARQSAYEADFTTLLRDFRYCLRKL